MTVQPFTLSWTYSKIGSAPEVDEAGLAALSPKGHDFVRQLKASLKAQTLYSRGAMLTSLSLLAACGGSGGGTTPAPTPTNQAPQAQDDKTLTVDEDMSVALAITAPTDPDAGDTLSITAVTAPTNGQIVLNGTAVTDLTTLTESDLPNLEYQPDANFNGTDTFGYTVSDQNGGTDTQTITVTINPINDGPPVVGANVTRTTDEDTDVALGIIAPTDPDPEQVLTISSFTGPTNGTLLLSGVAVADVSTLTVADLPNLSYRPDADENGIGFDSISYTVSDGVATSSQTITIDVNAVNDLPVLQGNKSIDVAEDTTAGTNLMITAPQDVDGDTLTTVNIDTIPGAAEGIIRIGDGGAALTAGSTITVADLANLQFVPAADFDGTTTFTYSVPDGSGETPPSQTITFNLTGSADDPEAQDDKSLSTDVGTETNLNIAAPTDPDTGDTLTITITDLPTEGQIQEADGTPVDLGEFSGDITGLKFVSEAGDSTGGAGEFAYEVEDLTGRTDDQTITLSLTSGTFDLSGGGDPATGSLNGSNGFQILGVSGGDIGASVTGGGDYNNDGLDDIAVASFAGGSGNVFLIFGGAVTDGGIFDPIPTPSLIVAAENGQTFSGVSGVGFGTSLDISSDVNNDGLADLIIGSPGSDNGGNTDNGEVFVVFGAAGDGTGTSRIIAGSGAPDGTDGVRFISAVDGAMTGAGVAVIGDINDDGINDIGIGRPGIVGGAGVGNGEVTIINGVDGSFAAPGQISDGDVDDVLTGAQTTSEISSDIASIGDVNNDGIDDFIVGDPGFEPSAGQPGGQAFVLFGGEDDLTQSISAAADLSFIGTGNDQAGAVAGGGDYNGDGIADFIIGSEGANANGADSGAALIIFGQSEGAWAFEPNFDGATDTITAPDGLTITGAAAGDGLGSEVTSIGDFNGDGIDDFALTAGNADSGDGAVYIVFGRTDIATGVDLTTTDSSSHIELTGDVTNFGQSISGSGDVNGDGLDDIIIGAENTAYVLFGFSNETGQTTTAESVVALDNGIILPDSDGDEDDLMPMDTQIADGDAGSQSSAMEGSEPVSAADALIADDIDLSGIA
ncbi:MAG: Ig-like domain-containing protein [Pseudomonadota bacterium]